MPDPDRATDKHPRALRGSSRTVAFRLSLGYALGALVWILISDVIVGDLNLPHGVETVVNSGKGLVFVLVTATILYVVTRLLVGRAEEQEYAQEIRIRQAYVDVLDAVTGGKLELLTEAELTDRLGERLAGPIALDDPQQLAAARDAIRAAVAGRFGEGADASGAINASGEALNNALKHAGRGTVSVYATSTRVQVAVTDDGPGIDFSMLPKATLVPGFSTTATLGMGFTIMLQMADCIMLSTRRGRTTVVAEASVVATEPQPGATGSSAEPVVATVSPPTAGAPG